MAITLDTTYHGVVQEVRNLSYQWADNLVALLIVEAAMKQGAFNPQQVRVLLADGATTNPNVNPHFGLPRDFEVRISNSHTGGVGMSLEQAVSYLKETQPNLFLAD